MIWNRYGLKKAFIIYTYRRAVFHGQFFDQIVLKVFYFKILYLQISSNWTL